MSEPTYEVLIPLDAEIPYQETSYYYGKIAVKEALLERDKCIQVTLDYDGNMKMRVTGSDCAQPVTERVDICSLLCLSRNLHNLFDDRDSCLHTFYCNMLERTMESISTGTEVRARKPHEA